MTFSNDSNEYFIVATGKETDEFENNSIGRILVLQVTSQRTLRLVHQIKTEGMVDCIRPFNGKLLASVRGMVKFFGIHQFVVFSIKCICIDSCL